MIKKTISYTDYFGKNRKEDFYFNLNKTELLEMEAEMPGGYAKVLGDIVHSEDNFKIVKILKLIVKKSYGEKSEDGRRFIKSQELSEAFLQTEAYNVMMMEFLQDAEAFSEFCNGLMPKDLSIDQEQVEKQIEEIRNEPVPAAFAAVK